MEKYTITVGQLIDSLRKEANDNLEMVVYVEDEHEGCLFGPKVIVDSDIDHGKVLRVVPDYSSWDESDG